MTSGRRIRDGKSADLEPIAPVGGWRAALKENVAATSKMMWRQDRSGRHLLYWGDYLEVVSYRLGPRCWRNSCDDKTTFYSTLDSAKRAAERAVLRGR